MFSYITMLGGLSFLGGSVTALGGNIGNIDFGKGGQTEKQSLGPNSDNCLGPIYNIS